MGVGPVGPGVAVGPAGAADPVAGDPVRAVDWMQPPMATTITPTSSATAGNADLPILARWAAMRGLVVIRS